MNVTRYQLNVCRRYHANQISDARYSVALDKQLNHVVDGLARVLALFK